MTPALAQVVLHGATRFGGCHLFWLHWLPPRQPPHLHWVHLTCWLSLYQEVFQVKIKPNLRNSCHFLGWRMLVKLALLIARVSSKLPKQTLGQIIDLSSKAFLALNFCRKFFSYWAVIESLLVMSFWGKFCFRIRSCQQFLLQISITHLQSHVVTERIFTSVL